jgi:hypothetical protein
MRTAGYAPALRLSIDRSRTALTNPPYILAALVVVALISWLSDRIFLRSCGWPRSRFLRMKNAGAPVFAARPRDRRVVGFRVVDKEKSPYSIAPA